MRFIHKDEREISVSDIQSLIHSGEHRKVFKVGDSLDFTLKDGRSLEVEIAGIDIYSNNELVFVTKDCYNELSCINPPCAGNKDGWMSSKLRSKLASQIFYYLPDELQHAIVVREITQAVEKYPHIKKIRTCTSADRIWLLSSTEIGVPNANDIGDKALPLFKDQKSRIKWLDFAPDYWWLRTTGFEHNSPWRCFRYVSQMGEVCYGAEESTACVVFGFIIRG